MKLSLPCVGASRTLAPCVCGFLDDLPMHVSTSVAAAEPELLGVQEKRS